ncbi:MAG TPA: acyl-CoA dehydrogenase, partial [Casimicrobiaceae bacterium]|nr:acyl-CoA dehydrogenase [Casimicrobiaceae bacterium]
DARITTIYEGTTGIQANDLIGRKTARDAGATARAIAKEIAAVANRLGSSPDPDLQAIGVRLAAAEAALQRAIDWIVPAFGSNTRVAHAGAVGYLRLWGTVVGGWQMARAAEIAKRKLAAREGDSAFLNAKVTTARYYADALLPFAEAYAALATGGGEAAVALAAESF